MKEDVYERKRGGSPERSGEQSDHDAVWPWVREKGRKPGWKCPTLFCSVRKFPQSHYWAFRVSQNTPMYLLLLPSTVGREQSMGIMVQHKHGFLNPGARPVIGDSWGQTNSFSATLPSLAQFRHFHSLEDCSRPLPAGLPGANLYSPQTLFPTTVRKTFLEHKSNLPGLCLEPSIMILPIPLKSIIGALALNKRLIEHLIKQGVLELVTHALSQHWDLWVR